MSQDTLMLTHVIMTRFNLATPGREAAMRNDPGWLADRFELFEDYCLPSVAAQTERGFYWILYFDENTPPEYKERITALRDVFPFHAYYTGLFPSEGWPRSVSETVSVETPFLLTSRLDNDDALSTEY